MELFPRVIPWTFCCSEEIDSVLKPWDFRKSEPDLGRELFLKKIARRLCCLKECYAMWTERGFWELKFDLLSALFPK
jgi:hypothetical protein